MTERRCNECTLCCKIVPVAEINKPANTRCKFQRVGKGCRVHQSAQYPTACALWACAWLREPNAALPRPDRAHYVIDPSPDFIEIDYPMLGRERIEVVQVWLDPKYPDAHRDPALRAYLADRGERLNEAAIVRFDERMAMVLFPPSMTSTGGWIESAPKLATEHHTAAEIYRR